MTYAARITALRPERSENEPPGAAAFHLGMEHALALAEQHAMTADTELTAIRARVGELERALQEADTIMGHDDSETEWREKWGALWTGAAITTSKATGATA